MKELKFFILVVDDDDCIRRFVRRTLETKGIFDVLEAGSGKEAEEIAKILVKQRRKVIVGMVIDFVLPDCRGPKAASLVREQMGWEVPVLYITGYDLEVLSEQGSTDGELILEKPFNHHQLLQYLECALRGIKEVAN